MGVSALSPLELSVPFTFKLSITMIYIIFNSSVINYAYNLVLFLCSRGRMVSLWKELSYRGELREMEGWWWWWWGEGRGGKEDLRYP